MQRLRFRKNHLNATPILCNPDDCVFIIIYVHNKGIRKINLFDHFNFADDDDEDYLEDENFDSKSFVGYNIKMNISDEDEDGFKVPDILTKRKRKKRRSKLDRYENEEDFEWKESKENLVSSSGRKAGRKKVIPDSVKSCAECGFISVDHDKNLEHWKDTHPDKEISYKCTEKDCNFNSVKVEDMYKHRSDHKKRLKELAKKEDIIEK